MGKPAENIKAQILQLVREYHQVAFPSKQFIPGETQVPYSGRVFDDDELVNTTDRLHAWGRNGRILIQVVIDTRFPFLVRLHRSSQG